MQGNYVIIIMYPLKSVIYLNYKLKFCSYRTEEDSRNQSGNAAWEVICVVLTVIQITWNNALCGKVLRLFTLE
jgi:TRAP-type mannitol/chloroaromatic compound transport system permease small subunit